ncbi:LOW QUALITY PROTEIN: RING finger protein 215 [Corvus cornix cornix]|uniref:LOW QUALITY PROTEIN: RING finger protein 215 n=1 Tax=Corvus cornix cornix TaxID=932674 RepID=UPI0019525032|nr:LOW QUALITY PROTEIN: RING finger protein 215 [Corvus cornix cornix]
MAGCGRRCSPLLALGRAGSGPPPARVEVAVSGPGAAGPDGDGAGSGAGSAGGARRLAGEQRQWGPGRVPCATPAAVPVPTQCPAPRTPGSMGVLWACPEPWGASQLFLSLPCPQVGDVSRKLGAADSWIGVVPVGTEEPAEGPRGAKEESFTTAMKRALVLGASALLILALNQNAIRELDVSQLLAKPVIVIQSSDNVTRLLGALLRGLRATAKITYQAVLLENLGVTLTLWSTCGLSRGGLYGEWQGVICPGESSSQVQKYLQQLWNTILLIALLLCTGVMVQAQRQSRQDLSERDAELDLKQHIRQRLSALKTRAVHPGKPPRSRACEIDSCAVCLDQFHKSQWLRVLPCSHEFHRDCVDPWLLLQQTCPLCKRNILGNCCTDS